MSYAVLHLPLYLPALLDLPRSTPSWISRAIPTRSCISHAIKEVVHHGETVCNRSSSGRGSCSSMSEGYKSGRRYPFPSVLPLFPRLIKRLNLQAFDLGRILTNLTLLVVEIPLSSTINRQLTSPLTTTSFRTNTDELFLPNQLQRSQSLLTKTPPLNQLAKPLATMCWAESLQYACACYHGHRIHTSCPRGDSRGSCPAIDIQGVTRTEGLCPPCRAKDRQGEALRLKLGAGGLAGVIGRAVSREVSPS